MLLPPAEHPPVPVTAADATDIILMAALVRRATALELEPFYDPSQGVCHNVSVRRGSRSVHCTTLSNNLGTAVIARLCLMAGLGVVHDEPATARFSIRADHALVEAFVTIQPSDVALTCELWLFEETDEDASEASALPSVLPIGHRIGAYELQDFLGRGGMGLVYRARHVHLERDYALKVLDRRILRGDAGAVSRFFWEAKAAARIEHEGIVRVSDVATLDDGRPYLVMELLDGVSLEEVTEDHEDVFQPGTALAMMISAAEALTAAHEAGVVHGDITPSNMFVCKSNGRHLIKLLDFGAAHLDGRTPDDGGPPEGFVIGTPYYLAPEQAQGKAVDERTDLYSYGVILFELLAGEVPFDGDSVVQIAQQHVFSTAPKVASPHRKLPRGLVQLVASLLAKNPADRPQTAREVADRLRKFRKC